MSAPNFLIVGERRSGTTTLARWIEAHPEIYLHPKMDMAFFWDRELVGAKEWIDGKVDYDKWYIEHSKEDYEANFPQETQYKAIGEKSADYLFWEPCHERIQTYYPDIKLVLTLRNPIERAWSMYWNEVGKGRETLTFEEAISQEEERIQKSDYAKAHLSYVSRGNYANSIKNLLKHFKKENLHIIVLEHSIANPEKALRSLYDFLGVDSAKGYDNVQKKFNKNWTLVQKEFYAANRIISTIEQTIFNGINLVASLIHRGNIYKKRKTACRD